MVASREEKATQPRTMAEIDADKQQQLLHEWDAGRMGENCELSNTNQPPACPSAKFPFFLRNILFLFRTCLHHSSMPKAFIQVYCSLLLGVSGM